MWIMISGPYTANANTKEQRAENLRAMNRIAYQVFQKGHVPIVGVNNALPIIEIQGEQTFDELMMPISLATAERCDAVLRIGGPSIGADQEVELFRKRGLPVFTKIEDIPLIEKLSF